MLRQSRWSVIAGIVASMSFVVVVVFMFLQAQVVQADVNQDILYVAPGGNCGAAAPCFDNVQAAVDAAADGDEIRIATGTYTGTHATPVPPGYQSPGLIQTVITQVVYITKSLAIQGGYVISNWLVADPDAHPTILYPNTAGRVFMVAGNINVAIQGLEIKGGNAYGLWGSTTGDMGAGIFVLSATVSFTDNLFVRNTIGGALGLWFTTASVIQNTFDDNYTGLSIVNGVAHIVNNQFTYNLQGVGASGSTIIVKGNTFYNNHNGANSAGAGVSVVLSQVTLDNNVFAYNRADYGGAIYAASGRITSTNNLIHHNTATGWGGGGMILSFMNGTLVNDVIINNHLADNLGRGSGIRVEYSHIDIAHATFSQNSGGERGAIYCLGGCYLTVTNSIISHQRVGVYSGYPSNEIVLDSTLWFNNDMNTEGASIFVITNSFEGDPAFMADGYHITPGSAAIDRGVSTFVTEDIDGTPRPAGAAPDLGADEFPELTEWFYLPVLSFPQ